MRLTVHRFQVKYLIEQLHEFSVVNILEGLEKWNLDEEMNDKSGKQVKDINCLEIRRRMLGSKEVISS